MRRTHRKTPIPGQGFSLVEIIFATSLLSLVMMLMFNLYPSSLLTVRQAEHRIEATAKAQSILEQDRVGPFAALASPSPPYAFDTTVPIPNAKDANFPSRGSDGVQYLADKTLTNKDAGAGQTHLVSDRVQVYWNERNDDPDPAHYHTWHSVTQELWVCAIKR